MSSQFAGPPHFVHVGVSAGSLGVMGCPFECPAEAESVHGARRIHSDRWGCQSFGGRDVHVVQVGLGTNSTFIQNLRGNIEDWNSTIAWMLEVLSEDKPGAIRGVGVEPVLQHVGALQQGLDSALPNVALVCAALGDRDCDGVDVHVLTKKHHDDLLRSVPEHLRHDLQYHLEYILNMSCVSCGHPDFGVRRNWLYDRYGVWVTLERMPTKMWSWQKLCCEFNFRGCELLIVDTEGHDAAILRSMIVHCQQQENCGVDAWPCVIQFETMSHCDKMEGEGTEWNVIRDLERHGYTMLHFSHHNSHVVRRGVLNSNERVQAWAGSFRCCLCSRRWGFPYCSDGDAVVYCQQCAAKMGTDLVGAIRPFALGSGFAVFVWSCRDALRDVNCVNGRRGGCGAWPCCLQHACVVRLPVCLRRLQAMSLPHLFWFWGLSSKNSEALRDD